MFAAKTQSQLEKDKLISQYHKKGLQDTSSAPPTLRAHEYNKQMKQSSSWFRDKNDSFLTKGISLPPWSHDLIFENKGAKKEPAHQLKSNLYQPQGIMARLNSQGSSDLNEMLNTRASFYTLGDFMEPVHHRVSSDEVTEYEDVEELPTERKSNVFGSARHLENLHKV